MHAVHFSADQTLLDFIQRKLDKLDTFHDRIISGEVFLKLDGSDTNKVKQKILEVRLNIPGKELFVSQKGTTFESATDQIVDVLKDKLVRSKEKRSDFSSPAIAEARTRMEADTAEADPDDN